MLFEHWGDNRSGKSLLNAVFAWSAYQKGKIVYCNCPDEQCILNFPHKHCSPSEFWNYNKELFDCYIMTDQGETSDMDSHRAMAKETLESGYFNLQATKRHVDWHYDTVRHKNIAPMMRLNAHYFIHSIRIPFDPNKQLKAVKVVITSRYSSRSRSWYLKQPWKFFPLFNSEVLVTPRRMLPPIESIHKQLVGP